MHEYLKLAQTLPGYGMFEFRMIPTGKREDYLCDNTLEIIYKEVSDSLKTCIGKRNKAFIFFRPRIAASLVSFAPAWNMLIT